MKQQIDVQLTERRLAVNGTVRTRAGKLRSYRALSMFIAFGM